MSLVPGTESQLTPKRLRSLWVAQDKDDNWYSRGKRFCSFLPTVWASAGCLGATYSWDQERRLDFSEWVLVAYQAVVLLPQKRQTGIPVKAQLLAKSGGMAGRQVSRLYFRIHFSDQAVHPELPVAKQPEASEAASMGGIGIGFRAKPLGREACTKSILRGSKSSDSWRPFKSTFKPILPTKFPLSPRLPKREIPGTHSGVGSHDYGWLFKHISLQIKCPLKPLGWLEWGNMILTKGYGHLSIFHQLCLQSIGIILSLCDLRQDTWPLRAFSVKWDVKISLAPSSLWPGLSPDPIHIFHRKHLKEIPIPGLQAMILVLNLCFVLFCF